MTALDQNFATINSDLDNDTTLYAGTTPAQILGNISKVNNLKIYNVLDYSATGNGSTDDSTAIQNAINAAGTAGGGIIYFPPGTYCCNNISVTVSGIYLKGCCTASCLANNSTNHPTVTFGNGSTMIYNFTVEDLYFSQKSGTPVSGNCAVQLNKAGGTRLKNVSVGNSPAAMYDGLSLINQCSQIFVNSCDFTNNLHNGLSSNGTNDLYVDNTKADANGNHGFYCVDMSGSYFTNVTAWGNTVNGFNIAQGALTQSENMFFTNCVGDTSGADNWVISTASRIVLTNCWGCTQKVTSTSNVGFYLDTIKDGTLSSCFALNNNTHGVYATGCSKVIFKGNHFTNNNQKSTTGIGLALTSCTNIIVSGNNLSDELSTHKQSYGLDIESSCSYVNARDNIITGNTAGSVNNLASTGIILADNQ